MSRSWITRAHEGHIAANTNFNIREVSFDRCCPPKLADLVQGTDCPAAHCCERLHEGCAELRKGCAKSTLHKAAQNCTRLRWAVLG